jgi:CcmD family protein
LSYLIAAYAAVIATLLVYGLRIQTQRRALLRRLPGDAERRAD